MRRTLEKIKKIKSQLISLPVAERKEPLKTYGETYLAAEGLFEVGYGSQFRGFIRKDGPDEFRLWDSDHSIRTTGNGEIVDAGVKLDLDSLMRTIAEQRKKYK